MKNTFRTRLLVSTLLIGSAAIGAPAMAQVVGPADPTTTTTTPNGTEETPGDIVVTGSRLQRPDLDAPSPVTTIDSRAFDLTGTVTVERLLNTLPQLIPGNTRVSNNQGGESFATLDLRGLGPQRTLILVDGERVPASSTSGVVDINTIPAGLIQRVDVVTGGASTVYGSDAIAGVVNFVLKDHFEGAQLSSLYTISSRGDGTEFNVEGLFGGNFAGGKGNLTLYASYYDRGQVSQSDRDFSRAGSALIQGADGRIRISTNPNDYNPANGDVIAASGGSATPPQGTINNNAGNPFGIAFTNVDSDCNAATPGVTLSAARTLSFDANNNLIPALTSGRCAFPTGASSRYNFNPANLLITPYNRIALSSTGRYEITDKLTFKILANYIQTQQTVNLAPTPATGIIVPYNSPFVPAALRAELASRPNPTADFVVNRRFSETGPRIGIYDSRTFNLRGTLQGEISSNWKYDATVSYGNVYSLANSKGNINLTAVRQGVLSCPAGSLPGCTPINIFGFNTLTPAMLNFVRIDTKELRQFTQTRATANISGTLFKLPGGPVAVAAGVEVRHDLGSVTVDNAQRTGNIYGFNAVQSQNGQITTKEVYGEVRLPLLGDLPFVHSLSLEGGIRYSDYSSVGGQTNYKGGAEYAPTSWLRFRGIYNKAARAPAISELFQNGDQGFSTVTDPCNFSITRTTAVRAQCLATGVPASVVDSFSQSNSQVQVFSFGNPNLKEEKADTYTLGTVINARRLPAGLGSLSLTVDYYHIKVKDLISAFGASYFLTQCYRAADPTACARITRDPATGQVLFINTATGNSGDLKTDGIDVGLNLAVPLTDKIGLPGRLRFNEVFTWVNSYQISGTEYVGLNEAGIGGQTPAYKSTLSTSYESDAFTVLLRWNFASSLREDILGDKNLDSRTPSLSYFDLSLSQRIGDHFELTAIANNVFYQKVRSTPIGYYDQANVDTTWYSNIILGRTFTVSAKVKF